MSRPLAVVFDLGGVVLDSPLAEIDAFEREHGLPPGIVNRTVAASGRSGAWARHERGEIPRAAFLGAFAAELRAAGAVVDTRALMERVDGTVRVRPRMLQAVRALRGEGVATAAVTNDWEPLAGGPLPAEFDVFLESVVEGVRKPEPEIYRRCVAALGVDPGRMLMLDDLGPNLKPARDLGMETVKVVSEAHALAVLAERCGIDPAG